MVDVREDANPLPISAFPTPPDRDYCKMGNFGPHNLHENRPGTFQSEETIFSTYHNAGVPCLTSRTSSNPGKSGTGFRRCPRASSIRAQTSPNAR
jgi:hypothetical protein